MPTENSETEDPIRRLEQASASDDIDVEQLLKEYKKQYPQPIWKMAEDMQRQAMVYYNIIEQLKNGRSAQEIKATMEPLGVVPGTTLPNPNIPALMQLAFDKVSRYRKALVEVVRRYGGELLNELSFETGLTISVEVNIGFPPSLAIGVEHTASAQTVVKY